MLTTAKAGGRVLVLGGVIPFGAKRSGARHAQCERGHDEEPEDQDVGGAANVARIVAELGVMVGLICTTSVDDSEYGDQLRQFCALLPQYDVVVLSHTPRDKQLELRRMIDLANGNGKRVLADARGGDFFAYAGAHVLTTDLCGLQRMMGDSRDEPEMTIKIHSMLAKCDIGALILHRVERGATLYSGRLATHFPTLTMATCGELIGAVAAMLAAGMTLPAALAGACTVAVGRVALTVSAACELEEMEY